MPKENYFGTAETTGVIIHIEGDIALPVQLFFLNPHDKMPYPKIFLVELNLTHNLFDGRRKMASLTEALAYMMPRTYEAPMQTEWVNIYTWLGLQYAMQTKGKDQLEAMIEIAPKELSDYEKGLLKKLRLWIYDKRRIALKGILKKNKVSKDDGILDIQEKLF